jgi:oligoribonuclease
VNAPRYLFCDLETNGLRKLENLVLEIGLIAIDDDFNTLAETSILVAIPPELVMEDVHPTVVEMHTKNGLFEELDAAYRTAEVEHGHERHTQPAHAYLQASNAVQKFLSDAGYEPGQVILCGHSIHFDRGFIQEQLPKFEAWLSHRMMDFGAIGRFLREQAKEWNIPFVEPAPMPHRGLLDARIELAEARNLRETLRSLFDLSTRNYFGP